jgi:antitoxin ParD1/3/4
MRTMNVSMPDSMKAFVEEQVAKGGYVTNGQYIRELIRREHEREKMRTLIAQGVKSTVTGVPDEAYFGSLRQRVVRRAEREIVTPRKRKAGTRS